MYMGLDTSKYTSVGKYSGIHIFLTWCWMLNEWVSDARLMEQQVTRLFILFHTDTTFIDRPIDPVASPFETLLPFFGTHRWLAPFIRLSLVCHSFIVRRSSVCCALSLAPYILKSGVPLQGHWPTVTYDYSDRTNHVVLRAKGFLRNYPSS